MRRGRTGRASPRRTADQHDGGRRHEWRSPHLPGHHPGCGSGRAVVPGRGTVDRVSGQRGRPGRPGAASRPHRPPGQSDRARRGQGRLRPGGGGCAAVPAAVRAGSRAAGGSGAGYRAARCGQGSPRAGTGRSPGHRAARPVRGPGRDQARGELRGCAGEGADPQPSRRRRGGGRDQRAGVGHGQRAGGRQADHRGDLRRGPEPVLSDADQGVLGRGGSGDADVPDHLHDAAADGSERPPGDDRAGHRLRFAVG